MCDNVPTTSNLADLVPQLRMWLGDMTIGEYTYTDQWLLNALASAVNSLGRWWNDKYLLDDNCDVIRNPNYIKDYEFDSPPVIEDRDNILIVLMASIIIKSGVIQNSAWNVGTWRDAEIYYSNTEGGKAAMESLKRDWEMLMWYLKPPTKKIAFKARRGKSQTLTGFRNSQEMITSDEPWKD